MQTTLLDPKPQSQNELYRFTERLSSGLPGLQGNTLLLLKIGVPTPEAGVALPRTLQEQMRIQFYLDVAPDKKFIRHVRPGAGAEETAGAPHSDAGGPVYRIWISRLPIPHKHAAMTRIGLVG